jgi:hypothetical protein
MRSALPEPGPRRVVTDAPALGEGDEVAQVVGHLLRIHANGGAVGLGELGVRLRVPALDAPANALGVAHESRLEVVVGKPAALRQPTRAPLLGDTGVIVRPRQHLGQVPGEERPLRFDGARLLQGGCGVVQALHARQQVTAHGVVPRLARSASAVALRGGHAFVERAR